MSDSMLASDSFFNGISSMEEIRESTNVLFDIFELSIKIDLDFSWWYLVQLIMENRKHKITALLWQIKKVMRFNLIFGFEIICIISPIEVLCKSFW
jgi:hypothetical protein